VIASGNNGFERTNRFIADFVHSNHIWLCQIGLTTEGSNSVENRAPEV
jgi:hypothetical protein